MRIIVPQGTVDFDSLGALVGGFVLENDTLPVMPEAFTRECKALVAVYWHKLPLSPRERWWDDDKQRWRVLLWQRMTPGVDFLQSLQMTKWLQAENRPLDGLFASLLLLGIFASTNHLDSFSMVDEVHGAVDFLVKKGADEGFVQHWLQAQGEQARPLPRFVSGSLSDEDASLAQIPRWQSLLMEAVCQAARDGGAAVYLAGGMVRDLFLSRPSHDLDFIIDGEAIPVAKQLQHTFGGRCVFHRPFGTARWEIHEALPHLLAAFPQFADIDQNDLPESVDMISARTEWYPKVGRLPQVRLDGIELDMQRRDFSINTLALRVDVHPCQWMDVCGGRQDLAAGIIRALHPRSFVDDPTRLFRAVRYEQRLGFSIEVETLRWMANGKVMLPMVSGDRIRHELNLLMAEVQPAAAFRRLDSLGLLAAVVPGWGWQERRAVLFAALLQNPLPAGWQIPDINHLSGREFGAYALLLVDYPSSIIWAVSERLLFSAEQQRQLWLLLDVLAKQENLRWLSASKFTAALEGLHESMLYVLHHLWQDDAELSEKLAAFRKIWRWQALHIDGHQLRQRGVAAGPLYGELFKAVRAAWIDGEITSEQEEADFVDAWLQQRGYGDG